MPKPLLDFMGYAFYFGSNENGEPIHIHVSKGKQTENVTKFWIKRDEIELIHNKSNIPSNDLKRFKNIYGQIVIQLLLDGIGILICREMVKITIQQKIDMTCARAGISKAELSQRLDYKKLQSFQTRYDTGKFTQEELQEIARATGKNTFQCFNIQMVQRFKAFTIKR